MRRIRLGTTNFLSITRDNCNLALSSCCAATHQGAKVGDSMLAFQLGAVTDDSDTWMEWCTLKMDATLRQEQATAPQATDPGNALKTQALLELLTAHTILGQQVQGTATSTQAQGMATTPQSNAVL